MWGSLGLLGLIFSWPVVWESFLGWCGHSRDKASSSPGLNRFGLKPIGNVVEKDACITASGENGRHVLELAPKP